MPKKIIIIGLILWHLLIVVLSLVNFNSFPTFSVNQIDKIYHLVFYAVLSILWSLFYLTKFDKLNPQSSFLWSFLLGLVIEILQDFTSYRTFDWIDVIFNTIGIAFGIIIVNKLKEFFKQTFY